MRPFRSCASLDSGAQGNVGSQRRCLGGTPVDDPLSPDQRHDLLPAPIKGRVVAEARETLRRIADGGAGLIATGSKVFGAPVWK